MKAAIVRKAGDTPVLADFDEPVAGDGEHRVTVTAAALAPLVRTRAAGAHYSNSGGFPFVVGVDGVGRLDDGRRVYFMLPRAPFGAMAERTVVSASYCIDVPEWLDDVMAAALANPGMSSWAALTRRARMKPGETVLINGATGMSGRLAVKIARHLGAAKVIATGRNAETLATLGADVTLALGGDDDAFSRALQAQFAEGVGVVVDYLWGPSAERILVAAAQAAPEGMAVRFVQVGTSGGANITLPGGLLRSSGLEIMGSGLKSVTLPNLLDSIAGVFGAAQDAGLSLPVHTLPLADIERAWAQPDDRRIVFTP